MADQNVDNALFTLRPAREEDMPYINTYAFYEGMDEIPGTENVTVAVNGQDVPVGFVRLFASEGEVGYVNPIVVHSEWRGYGIGEALMEAASESFKEMRLVSRGSSLAFYRALGYEDIGWDEVAPVASDCDGCPMRDECHPQPVHLIR